MEMQGAVYGIFENEIEPVLNAIRRHDDLATVEAMSCPCCGSRLRVDFDPDGRSFQVLCLGKPPHLSVLQVIESPPVWWTERIIEPVESIVSSFLEEEPTGIPSEAADARSSTFESPEGNSP